MSEPNRFSLTLTKNWHNENKSSQATTQQIQGLTAQLINGVGIVGNLGSQDSSCLMPCKVPTRHVARVS